MEFNKRLVVFDVNIPQLLDNKVFDTKYSYYISHTLVHVKYLFEQSTNNGFELITPDVYLDKYKGKPALLVSNLTSNYTNELMSIGVRPAVLVCLESPFIATRFYIELRKISAIFKHSFVFSGMEKQLSKKTIYHQMYFPESFNVNKFVSLPFEQKKFITMISGNKKIGNWKKDIILKVLYGLGVKEIYSLRQQIINFFADKNIFDLYGMGWGKGVKNEINKNNINKVYRGTVEDKHEVLKNYKFAFCFENSIFPGYITEKIFDVMFAGCIPVYCGAPDIKKIVPSDCFVDLRDFKNFSDMTAFLESINEQIYTSYITNIKKFLNSEAYRKFSQENYAKTLIEIFNQEF